MVPATEFASVLSVRETGFRLHRRRGDKVTGGGTVKPPMPYAHGVSLAGPNGEYRTHEHDGVPNQIPTGVIRWKDGGPAC